MSWFCTLPFSHLHTTTDGKFRLCCMATGDHQSHNMHDHTIKDWWYSDELNQLRKEFVTGKLDKVKTICSKCITDETNKAKSYRQYHDELLPQHIEDFDAIIQSKNHFEQTGEFKHFGRQLSLSFRSFGNYCNLSCYTCLPQSSSRRTTDLKKLGWYEAFGGRHIKTVSLESTFKQIEELLPETAAMVIIGGEPLLMKEHYDFLDMIIESGHSKEIILSYTTNLTLLNIDKRNFLDYVDQFKQVAVNVSIDGIGKRNDYIRYGSNWDQLVNNYRAIEGKVIRQVYFTTSILSVFDCKKAAELFPDILFDITIVTTPDFLSVKHLPEEIKINLLKDLAGNDKFKGIMKELNKDRDEKQFQKAINYIKALDRVRDVKSYELFEELQDVLR